MNERVRVGVIGAGTFGIRHCRTLAQRTPAASLVAVADYDERAGRAAAALDREAYATNDYQTLLADPSIHAVIITVPNDQHARIVAEAAEAGKHIYCEKPLALTLADAESVLRTVAERGVALQIGFQRRFDTAYREARRAVAAGELGDVELLFGTTKDPAPPSAEYLDHSGSIFSDLAIHDFDSLRFLTGLEVTEVFASAATLIPGDPAAPPDTATTSLRLSNGALAVITNSRRSNFGYDVRTEISGSQGMVAVGDGRPSAVRTFSPAGDRRGFVGSYWELFEAAYVEEIRHFVDCVATGRAPDATGDDGLRALEIAILAERSVAEGRPVTIDELR